MSTKLTANMCAYLVYSYTILNSTPTNGYGTHTHTHRHENDDDNDANDNVAYTHAYFPLMHYAEKSRIYYIHDYRTLMFAIPAPTQTHAARQQALQASHTFTGKRQRLPATYDTAIVALPVRVPVLHPPDVVVPLLAVRIVHGPCAVRRTRR